MRNTFLALLAVGSLFLNACQSGEKDATATASEALPYPGKYDADQGEKPSPVPPFRLLDQAGQPVGNETLAGRAYVIDFFFASCPGICPRMQGQLLKVFKQFPADPRVAFVSVTIDPAHDSTAVLKDYAERLGVADANRWHFATTGNRDSALTLANRFFTGAMADAQAPGGFAHNGTLALVDDRGFVRGLYDGLNDAQVAKLAADIPLLLKEVSGRKAVAKR